MCVYPLDKAYATAFFVSPFGDCQVPNPKAGISAPVLSLKWVAAMIEKVKSLSEKSGKKEICPNLYIPLGFARRNNPSAMMQDVVEWGKLACKTRSRCRGNFPEAEQSSAEEWGEEAGEGTNESRGFELVQARPLLRSEQSLQM